MDPGVPHVLFLILQNIRPGGFLMFLKYSEFAASNIETVKSILG
jgi:hypothetical protein